MENVEAKKIYSQNRSHRPSELLLMSATRLAELIRTSQISALEVMSAHIDHAQRVNPSLNAIVEDRYAAAIKDAKALDNSAKEWGAVVPRFFGVPFTVKETISLEGAPHTCGTIHRRGLRAKMDAVTVQRLRGAGAIPIGSTNIPEWAFWWECNNLIYGTTRNPYDPTCTPGGSSGGEGAIIGAGASPFGIAGEVGGSIRIPATFCGIFGHKPTNKTVPLTGHYPLYPETAADFTGNRYPYTTHGVLCRRAGDLAPLLTTLIGEDGIDRETGTTRDLAKVRAGLSLDLTNFECRWKTKKVWLMPQPKMTLVGPTTPEVARAVHLAGETFADLGAHVDELPAGFFQDAFSIWMARIGAIEGPALGEIVGGGQAPSVFKEALALARGTAQYTWPTLFACAAEKVSGKGDSAAKMLTYACELVERLETLLGEDGLLILPAHPRPAPRLNSTWQRPFDFAMAGLFNVLETPATAAPIYLSKNGLPIGVQLISSRGSDHVTIAAALALEAAGYTWRPPPSHA